MWLIKHKGKFSHLTIDAMSIFPLSITTKLRVYNPDFLLLHFAKLWGNKQECLWSLGSLEK